MFLAEIYSPPLPYLRISKTSKQILFMQPYIGQIMLFAGSFAPNGWTFCNGQTLNIADHQALFNILGTTYGGDGSSTFALPDLRGRAPIHFGQGPGLTLRTLGESGGDESNTLSVQQMPSHNHGVSVSVNPKGFTGGGDETNPTDGYLSNSVNDLYVENPNVNMGPSEVSVNQSDVGGNQPVENMPPFVALNYCIALYGTMPV